MRAHAVAAARLLLFALAALLSACGSLQKISPMPLPGMPRNTHPKVDPSLPVLPKAGSGRGGYYQDDGPGENPPAGLAELPDAVVTAEPYSKYANRPYEVFGKTYKPMLDNQPFMQRGVASWYGKKFHGQRTSSGELYDMYKMTAAHPTLPIPSYARITNLDNGKQVVVRINDRGPFHSSRIVDVSYTAALKLGLLAKGSHEVQLERLLPNQPNGIETIATQRRNAPVVETAPVDAAPESAPSEIAALMLEDRIVQDSEARAAPAPGAGDYYVQLGAFSRADAAEQMRSRLERVVAGTLEMVQAGALYRLFGGPFQSRAEAAQAAAGVSAALGLKPIVVRRDGAN
jgi:rare lipoprotein A